MKKFLESPLSVALIIINVGVFVLAERTGATTDTATLIRWGASNRALVWDGQAWRLLTSVFLHIGFIHLFWNAYAGFSWCARVEAAFGHGWFLVIYLLSGLAGSAVSVIGHDVVSAGASGSLFGMIGVELLMLYRKAGTFEAFKADPLVRRQLLNIGVWFLIGATMLAMDNYAHAGGLVAGLALAAVLTAKNRSWKTITPAIVGVAVLVGLALRPIPVLHQSAQAERATKAAAARGDLDEVVRLSDPIAADPRVFQSRMDALTRLGRHADAEREATQRIAADPRDANGYFYRGFARTGLKQPAGAIEDFGATLALAPGHAWTHYLRAHAYRELGSLAEAKADLDRAIALDPKLCEAYWLRAIVEEGADARLADLTKAIAVCADPTQVLLARAELHFEAGRLVEALKDADAAIAASPDGRGGYALRIAIRLEQKDLKGAAADCTLAMERASDVTVDLAKSCAVLRGR